MVWRLSLRTVIPRYYCGLIMGSSLHIVRVLVVASCLGLPCAQGQTSSKVATLDKSDLVVHVTKHGETIVVDVEMAVQEPPLAVWDVLTDYDHMAQFIANVHSSRIADRTGNRLIVAQQSSTAFGLLKFNFDNVREVELVPHSEIRSKLISGDMKASAFTTRLVIEGNVTRVFNHGEFIPTMWVPPVVGTAFIESETRRQFLELRNEMMRRAAARKTAAPSVQ